MWSIFDIYCLVEASPGSNHTGYYIFSFDFVYVGNHHGKGFLNFCAQDMSSFSDFFAQKFSFPSYNLAFSYNMKTGCGCETVSNPRLC
jgi:hypothetical protein